MLTTKTREEKFGTITYNPSNDKFSLKTNLDKHLLLEQKLSAPLTMHWILTMKCNARCPYCYELPNLLKPSDKENIISKNGIDKFIDDFAKVKGFRLYLTGGEPTLSPLITYIVKTAYEKQIKCVVNSNGIKMPENIYQTLKDCESRLSLSLDSYKKELHDIGRKQKSYDSIVNVIKRAVLDQVDVRVISVLEDYDINYYKEFGSFLSDLGVNHWFIQEKTYNGSEKPINNSIEDILKKEFPNIQLRVLPAIFDSFMYILPNGEFGVNLWNRDKNIYGNILEKTISEIWQIHPYNKVKNHNGILKIYSHQ